MKNLEPMPEKKYKSYEPIISEKINHLELFEKGVPPPREKFETKEQKQEREVKEKLKANIEKNREEAKNCKYPLQVSCAVSLLRERDLLL